MCAVGNIGCCWAVERGVQNTEDTRRSCSHTAKRNPNLNRVTSWQMRAMQAFIGCLFRNIFGADLRATQALVLALAQKAPPPHCMISYQLYGIHKVRKFYFLQLGNYKITLN